MTSLHHMRVSITKIRVDLCMVSQNVSSSGGGGVEYMDVKSLSAIEGRGEEGTDLWWTDRVTDLL
jgi:hypothetical protein